MENFKSVKFFTKTDKLYRLTGDRLNGKCCATLGIAVQFGKNNTTDFKSIIKTAGDADRFLTGHGVSHKEYFARFNSLIYLTQFIHQKIIYLVTTCSIENNGIIAIQFSKLHGTDTDIKRFLVSSCWKYFKTELTAHCFELFNSGRAVHISRHQYRATFLFFK